MARIKILLLLCGIALSIILPACWESGKGNKNVDDDISRSETPQEAATINLNKMRTFNADYNSISVMTYNVRREKEVQDQPYEDTWDSKRDDRVIELLEKYSADIICLQEVRQFSSDFSTKDSNQFNNIKNAIEDRYDYFKGERSNKEYSPIFYKETVFSRKKYGYLRFNSGRIATFVKLEHLKTKIHYYIFNTHFTSGGNENDAETRKNEAKELEDYIKSKVHEKYAAIIVTGDFNLKTGYAEDKYAYDVFTKNTHLGFKDSYTEISYNKNYGIADTAPHFSFVCNNSIYKYPDSPDKHHYCTNWRKNTEKDFGTGIEYDDRIDFIFHSLALKTTYSNIITDNYWIRGLDDGEEFDRASDHDPVLSIIEVEPDWLSSLTWDYLHECDKRPCVADTCVTCSTGHCD